MARQLGGTGALIVESRSLRGLLVPPPAGGGGEAAAPGALQIVDVLLASS